MVRREGKQEEVAPNPVPEQSTACRREPPARVPRGRPSSVVIGVEGRILQKRGRDSEGK